MLIRIRIDLAFTTENQGIALGIQNHIVNLMAKAVVVNEGEVNEERGYISAEQCYHDETPPRDCVELARWEVRRGKVK